MKHLISMFQLQNRNDLREFQFLVQRLPMFDKYSIMGTAWGVAGNMKVKPMVFMSITGKR